jgi:hypothetical protein
MKKPSYMKMVREAWEKAPPHVRKSGFDGFAAAQLALNMLAKMGDFKEKMAEFMAQDYPDSEKFVVILLHTPPGAMPPKMSWFRVRATGFEEAEESGKKQALAVSGMESFAWFSYHATAVMEAMRRFNAAVN